MSTEQEVLWAKVNNASQEGSAWLRAKIEDVITETSSIVRPFAAVGRKVAHIEDAEDAARTLLLIAAGQSAWNYVDDLYAYGDARERRGVLKSLSYLPSSDKGLDVISDAIRSNDPSLIKAALGKYAFARMSDDEVNQAILKCVFMEISLGEIDGLSERVNPTMSEMLAHLARERVAAGREVSSDIWPFVCKYPPKEVLNAIRSDMDSPIPVRQEAAIAAVKAFESVSKEVQ